MITERRLYLLMCVFLEEDINHVSDYQWLIDEGYVDETGECTEKGRMTVQYATKKAGEI